MFAPAKLIRSGTKLVVCCIEWADAGDSPDIDSPILGQLRGFTLRYMRGFPPRLCGEYLLAAQRVLRGITVDIIDWRNEALVGPLQ